MKGENIILLNHESLVEAVEEYINKDRHAGEAIKVIRVIKDKHYDWRVTIRPMNDEG